MKAHLHERGRTMQLNLYEIDRVIFTSVVNVGL